MEFISRSSKTIECPNWFTENFPDHVELDGELWMGRQTLENMLSILNSDCDYNFQFKWKDLKYMIFDLPFSDQPYEARMEELKKLELPSHA